MCKHRFHTSPEGPFTSLALAVGPGDQFGLVLCTGSGTLCILFPAEVVTVYFLTPPLPVSLCRVLHLGLESTNLRSPHHCQRLSEAQVNDALQLGLLRCLLYYY